MTKERIIYAAVLLAAIASFGGVYQFYFKGKLSEYARDEAYKQMLQQTFDELEQTFAGVKPEVFVSEWSRRVQPWRDAVRQRSTFFTFGDWYDHESPPKDVLLTPWYDSESTRMLERLYTKVRETPGLQVFPPDIRVPLNIPTLDQITGKSITEQDVNIALADLSFGISFCRMLLDAKAKAIYDIRLWPKRTERATERLLRLQTVGVSMAMETRDLIQFIENQLRLADRFYTIDAIRIDYPYISQPYEPVVQVEMLITMARYIGRADAPAGGAGTPGTTTLASAGGEGSSPDVDAMIADLNRRRAARGDVAQKAAEPTMLQRAWKLFKRYVLYTN